MEKFINVGVIVEISEILSRFAEGLVIVDKETQHESRNQRTGEVYLKGVKTMSEPKFIEEFLTWWLDNYPHDFTPSEKPRREVPYTDIPRAKCDLVFSTQKSTSEKSEWAIEIKHIALIGNNGKNNDYGVAKILSPYLKDRSLIHDIERLRDYGIGERKAVIGYCFDYSFATCLEAIKFHPSKNETITNIKEVCKKNDPNHGYYSARPMIEFANEIFVSRKLVKNLQIKEFKNAWRHPCGGAGIIFGWELC